MDAPRAAGIHLGVYAERGAKVMILGTTITGSAKSDRSLVDIVRQEKLA
jgi:hypothetical protein